MAIDATTRRRSLMRGYAVAHLDEIEEASDGRCPWRPVRQHFGITAFGASAWTGRNVGDRIINEHDEREREPGHLRADDVEDDANEELYLVHRGRARFELDGDHVDAPAGTFVFVPPGVRRTAFAEEPGTTIVAVGGIPGKAYEPVGWEVWRPFHPVYESGAYAEVVARGRELIEASGYPEPLYNLACCESLSGRTADAIEHLRLSLASTQRYRERLRSLARADTDFDPIRDEPAFRELIGG
jgi:AraC-like ligand binding domain